MDGPDAQTPDIAGRLLFQKSANLVNFGPTTAGIEKKVAELATVRLDVDGAFCGPGIALEDEDLVLGSAFLFNSLHDDRRLENDLWVI